MTTLGELAPPELVASIQSAAQADAVFAAAFLADPKGAYQQRFGSELVPGYEVKVRRTADGASVLYVPGVAQVFSVTMSPTDELSDDELEFVSAGGGTTTGPMVMKGF
jgi:hypothetical protein